MISSLFFVKSVFVLHFDSECLVHVRMYYIQYIGRHMHPFCIVNTIFMSITKSKDTLYVFVRRRRIFSIQQVHRNLFSNNRKLLCLCNVDSCRTSICYALTMFAHLICYLHRGRACSMLLKYMSFKNMDFKILCIHWCDAPESIFWPFRSGVLIWYWCMQFMYAFTCNNLNID